MSDPRLGEASFRTDRGAQDLPAWLFTVAGAREPVAVLALAPSTYFGVKDAHTSTSIVAHTTADDQLLSVDIPSGASVCPGPRQMAVLTETATAVEVTIRPSPGQPVPPSPTSTTAVPMNCPDVLVEHPEPYTLQSSLGRRVVIDDKGVPVDVSGQ